MKGNVTSRIFWNQRLVVHVQGQAVSQSALHLIVQIRDDLTQGLHTCMRLCQNVTKLVCGHVVNIQGLAKQHHLAGQVHKQAFDVAHTLAEATNFLCYCQSTASVALCPATTNLAKVDPRG
jgi:hypothetical protein